MQFTATQKTTAAWCGIAAVMVLIVWLLGPVLTPFIVACVLAYALTPVVNKLDHAWGGKIPRIVAVAIVEVVFIACVLAIALLIVPILAKEIPLIRERLPYLAEQLNGWLSPLLLNLGIQFTLDVASIKAFVLKYLSANFDDSLAAILNYLKVGGAVVVTLIGYAILIPVALFYLLLDWENFVKRAIEFVPRRFRAGYDSFMREADELLGQYFRGQASVMVILAAYYSIGLALFGLDLALPIGVFTGLAMFVPYVGFGIGLILALLAGLLEFASVKAIVMVAVVFGSGQLIEGLFLTPRLVGERIGLHPLTVIFALLAFGQVFGFVGVLIALPASAVLLVAIRRLKAKYLASDLYRK
jgi:predicted PurR-regulated permease PerM